MGERGRLYWRPQSDYILRTWLHQGSHRNTKCQSFKVPSKQYLQGAPEPVTHLPLWKRLLFYNKMVRRQGLEPRTS